MQEKAGVQSPFEPRFLASLSKLLSDFCVCRREWPPRLKLLQAHLEPSSGPYGWVEAASATTAVVPSEEDRLGRALEWRTPVQFVLRQLQGIAHRVCLE